MAKTPSNMLALGTEASHFSLLNPVLNKHQSLSSLKGKKGTVIVFSCNHCPFVHHIEDQLIALAHLYQASGIEFVVINANDSEAYPQDAPEHMIQRAKDKAYPFPYLFDDTQDTARVYQAACTPDFYLFDPNNRLVYRGQMDDSRPGNNVPVTGESLVLAMDALLEGKAIDSHQQPSLGCNIKWKS